MRASIGSISRVSLVLLTVSLSAPALAVSDFYFQSDDQEPDTLGHFATSPHKLFMSTDSTTGEQFDVWKMDTGYAYSVVDNIDLYVATRISNAPAQQVNRGFLSGLNYAFNERISVNSAIYVAPDPDAESVYDTMAAEVSGKYMLTESLNLKATVDYEEWQSGIEVKLGFSF